MREITGYSEVILGGGVFQNHFLLELACQLLEKRSLKAYINRIVPANDGGISPGHVYYGVLKFKE